MIELETSIENIFEMDGSLRDFYILKTDKIIWDKFLDFLRDEAITLELYIDNHLSKISNLSIQKIFEFRKKSSVLLKVIIGDIIINCFFFDEEEIEFDIDPKQFQSEDDRKMLFDFIDKMASVMNREIILTEENFKESILAKFRA